MNIIELCNRASISQMSFYRLKKTDSNFSKLLLKHSIKANGKAVEYDEQVLQYLQNRFRPSAEVAAAASPTDAAAAENTDTQASAVSEEMAALRAELAETRTQAQQLSEKLIAAQATEAELRNQISMLLMLLQQEKEEKRMLLPPPRRSLSQRLRAALAGFREGNEQK